MTDSEWIANIQNISNAEIFEQLEMIGCDGYYRDIWNACIEELQRRVNNPTGDLISRSALLKELNEYNEFAVFDCEAVKDLIDNAPTVEVPENEVNCVLTMFGKCSYNETGCGDCEIKDKIFKALKEKRAQGEWVRKEDVIHSIAKQYSEHNELVPIWLSIGDLNGGTDKGDN